VQPASSAAAAAREKVRLVIIIISFSVDWSEPTKKTKLFFFSKKKISNFLESAKQQFFFAKLWERLSENASNILANVAENLKNKV
jgi:hypothetical protein